MFLFFVLLQILFFTKIMEIKIDDNRVHDFSERAKQELLNQSEMMVFDLIDEVCRVEEGRREGSRSEITQSDVVEAVRRSTKRIHHHKKKWWEILLQVLSPSLFGIAGFVYDKQNVWGMIFITLGSLITLYLIMKEENNG